MSSPYSAFADLPDDQLLAEVTRLATRERQATTDLVASLAVLDARRLYLREGYPSLFAYCTGALHLDGGQATVDQIRLLCSAHHSRETERWFGERPVRRPHFTGP